MKKFINRIVIFIILFSFASTLCQATGFVDHEYTPTVPNGTVTNFVNTILLYLSWAGYAISVGMIAFIGIKYLIASADEKASMKGTLVKVVVGAVIVATATTLTNFVISVFS